MLHVSRRDRAGVKPRRRLKRVLAPLWIDPRLRSRPLSSPEAWIWSATSPYVIIFPVTDSLRRNEWNFLQVLMSKRKHIFISHHHADDEHVTRLTDHAQRTGI